MPTNGTILVRTSAVVDGVRYPSLFYFHRTMNIVWNTIVPTIVAIIPLE